MTRNVYLGASLDPVTSARSLDQLAAGVDEVWDEVVATDPPARMAAIAREIAAAAPDAVALQEAARWRADGVEHDLLSLLLAALPGYRLAAAVENFGGALPGARAGLVSFQDRGALLVRAGARVEEARGVRLAAVTRLPVAGQEVEVPRGVVAARVDGVRVLGVHLELAHLPPLAAIQAAQVSELRALAAAGDGPVVLLGDLNSRPGAPAHAALVADGLADAWAEAASDDDGLTCCQSRALRNARSSLFERIDHVLARGLAGRGAFRTGLAPASGLWPSDHAGVVVDLA